MLSMNDATETDWITIGPHTIRFEPPDLIFSRPVGVLNGPDSDATWALAHEWAKDVPDVYWIMDISTFDHYSGAAVQAARVNGLAIVKKLQCLVCVGGGYRQRMVMSVVLKATGLLRLVTHVPEYAFVDTLDEARVVIDRVRKQRAVSGSFSPERP
jgi:hypothetical protein